MKKQARPSAADHPFWEESLLVAGEQKAGGADIHDFNSMKGAYRAACGVGWMGDKTRNDSLAEYFRDILRAWLSGRAQSLKEARKLITRR